MIETEVQVSNRLGLHARAAARFVHLANRYTCKITVARDGHRADGKSILGLLTLAASQGTRLRLMAVGADGREALDALTRLVDERFGEEE